MVSCDSRFRERIFEFAKLPSIQQNKLEILDEQKYNEDFKIKIKDFKDDYYLWEFIRANESNLLKITNWENYRHAISDSNEMAKFKMKTQIIFEYKAEKQNFPITEFDSMVNDLIKELESNNIHIWFRGFIYNGYTVGLGVMEPYRRITPNLFSYYSQNFRNSGVVKISLREKAKNLK